MHLDLLPGREREWPADLRIGAAQDQVSADLGGETAILNLTTGVYYGLDAVGNWIWQQIQEPTTLQEVLDRLLAEFDVDPARARQDLIRLLGELDREGLVELAFPGGPADAR